MNDDDMIQVQQTLKTDSFGRAEVAYTPLINGKPYPLLTCELVWDRSVMVLVVKTPSFKILPLTLAPGGVK